MKLQKLLAFLLAALLLGLTACGRSEGEKAEESGPIQIVEEETAITVWAATDFGGAEGYLNKLADAFMETYANVMVEVIYWEASAIGDALISAVKTGSAPDVLVASSEEALDYAQQGLLTELDSLATDALRVDMVSTYILDACGDGTNQWLYPLSCIPCCMALSLSALEESGAIAYINLEGDRGWTAKDFAAAVRALAMAGDTVEIPCGGTAGDMATRSLITNLYGAAIYNGSQTACIFESEESNRALNLLRELIQEGSLTANGSATAEGQLARLKAGELAISLYWCGEELGEDEILVPYPNDSGNLSLEFAVKGMCIFDNDDSSRSKVAKAFVSYACGDEAWGPQSVAATGGLPVRVSQQGLLDGGDDMDFLLSLSASYGPSYHTVTAFEEMRVLWQDMLRTTLVDGNNIADAVYLFMSQTNAAMDETRAG